jgi:hypothetical protein
MQALINALLVMCFTALIHAGQGNIKRSMVVTPCRQTLNLISVGTDAHRPLPSF